MLGLGYRRRPPPRASGGGALPVHAAGLCVFELRHYRDLPDDSTKLRLVLRLAEHKHCNVCITLIIQ